MTEPNTTPDVRTLRDRIIEGERELDGTDPQTLCFLMAEHWKAVAMEHRAKAKDYDRIKNELRLARLTTAAPAVPAEGAPSENREELLGDAIRSLIAGRIKCSDDLPPNKRPVHASARRAFGAVHTLLYASPLSAPAGWKVVPVEPTGRMEEAGKVAGEFHRGSDANDVYRAMLAASPEAPK